MAASVKVKMPDPLVLSPVLRTTSAPVVSLYSETWFRALDATMVPVLSRRTSLVNVPLPVLPVDVSAATVLSVVAVMLELTPDDDVHAAVRLAVVAQCGGQFHF